MNKKKKKRISLSAISIMLGSIFAIGVFGIGYHILVIALNGSHVGEIYPIWATSVASACLGIILGFFVMPRLRWEV